MEVVGGGSVNIVASVSVAVTAPAITLNGPVQVNGSLTASGTITAPHVVGTTDVTFGGKVGTTHQHSGVQTGLGNTGAPI